MQRKDDCEALNLANEQASSRCKPSSFQRVFFEGLSYPSGFSKGRTEFNHNLTLHAISNVRTQQHILNKNEDIQHVLVELNIKWNNEASGHSLFPPRVGLTSYNHFIAQVPHTPMLPGRPGKPEDGAFLHETPLVWALRAHSSEKGFPGISQELYPPPQNSRQLS